jgi:hypothetical protein
MLAERVREQLNREPDNNKILLESIHYLCEEKNFSNKARKKKHAACVAVCAHFEMMVNW